MQDGAEAEYSLFGVVVHVGSGPNHGHYVSLVKSHNHWLFFGERACLSIVQTNVSKVAAYVCQCWVSPVVERAKSCVL